MASRFFGVVMAGALAASPAQALTGAAPYPAGTDQAVMILNEGGGFCTALALDRMTLITAAHCVAGGRAMRIHWRGDGGEPVMRGAATVAVHPEFVRDAVRSRKRSIDLALVRLAEPLPATFSTVALTSAAQPRAGAKVAALGFGPTSRNDPKSAGVMRRGELAVVEPYGPSSILLWVQSPTVGVCPGDSGGALEDGSGAIAAIIAWGGTTGASGCGGPAQGVLVGPQKAWIDRVLAGWGGRAEWR